MYIVPTKAAHSPRRRAPYWEQIGLEVLEIILTEDLQALSIYNLLQP